MCPTDNWEITSIFRELKCRMQEYGDYGYGTKDMVFPLNIKLHGKISKNPLFLVM